MSLAHQELETPIGRYRISASEAGLLQLAPLDEPAEPARSAGARQPASATARRHLHQAARALEDYFEGRRRAFDDLTLAASGTPFQRGVWTALRRIPFGATRSYAELAGAIGRPGAARAVGRANGSNPLAILVPCHRVIGADGHLTGYAGGVWRKQWLLAHEEASSARMANAPALPTAATPPA